MKVEVVKEMSDEQALRHVINGEGLVVTESFMEALRNHPDFKRQEGEDDGKE